MRALFVTDDFIVEPLGIMWLSSYLKEAGHEVDIVKTNDGLKNIAKPDMLCYSVTTGKHTYYRDLNLQLQKDRGWHVPAVFGGPHPTFFPAYAHEPGVNALVRGEGFDAIVDLANAFENGGDLSVIPNVTYNELINPVRPLKDKSNILHPDRELIYKYPENYHNPIKNVMCSFGCPYSCSYCYNVGYRQLYHRNTLQIRSVDSVISEIEGLRKYPLKLLFFNDDIFPLYKPDWLWQFCDEYKKIGILFHIQIRIELLTEESLKQLKDVGLHGVTFAIESGNQELRNSVLKRYMTDDTIVRGADLLHKYGVKIRTENMLGIPCETWDTAMETLDLNIKCSPTLAWASLYQPYPGTELGDQCFREGTFDGNLDSIAGSFFDTYKLNVPDATRFDRLQKLFSLVVEYPQLRRWVGILSSVPLDRLYRRIYKKFKQYNYDTKLYAVDS